MVSMVTVIANGTKGLDVFLFRIIFKCAYIV